VTRARVRCSWIAPIVVAIAAAAGSCTEINTSPTAIAALEFDSLPYPAIVTGDSLRDSLGKAVPLRAKAFNGAGGLIPNPTIRFLALDSGLTIGETGLVTAQARSGTIRVIASTPGLQSNAETLFVARRPDSVFATSPVLDTLAFSIPDSASVNVTPALALKVATRDTAGGITGSQGWRVSYRVLFRGAALAATDTTVASLVIVGGGKPALLGTTGPDGTLAPTLRVRSTLLPTAPDSLTVVATVRYHGVAVPGSPLTYVIQIHPKPH
jgi:hypothetical protein